MKKYNTRTLILIALFAALTAVLAQIQLPLGPVPFNLAVLGAFLAGMLLPPLAATLSMGVYMMLGIIGIPVFAGFAGGPAVLFGKTGGYVLGYIAIAFCTSFAMQKSGKLIPVACAMALGLVACYTLGTVWFMIFTGMGLMQSLTFCVLPFIIPDIAKGACAWLLGKTLQVRLSEAVK
ncbi:MAG: biotin transporter BioY [Ruthenibacterium sp.]